MEKGAFQRTLFDTNETTCNQESLMSKSKASNIDNANVNGDFEYVIISKELSESYCMSERILTYNFAVFMLVKNISL